MDPLSRGEGALFSDVSSDRARAFFATKSRACEDKLTTVDDAVRRFVHDGDYLAVGGFGCDRIPTAVVHEIVRQGKQNLSFADHTATHDFQILCAGNGTGRGKTLAKVDVAYVVGLEARGLSPHARRVLESGDVECTEWSNYTLAVRLKAAAMGLPFLPARSLLGTDTFGRDILSRIVHAARLDFAIAFSVAGLALAVGSLLGALAGYAGGILDDVVMRLVERELSSRQQGARPRIDS